MEWLQNLILPAEHPTMVQSMVTVMLAIGLGVYVGRLQLGKVTLGVSGVMFTGLLLGHLGYRIQPELLDFLRDFGLIIFVYGIGLQVGPSFFSSFKNDGLKFNLLALGSVILSGFLAYLIFRFSGQRIENVVGIMSGAVTNTPGLGAAKNTIAELSGNNAMRKFDDPAIGYAITYPLGVFGIILMIILSKTILKVNPVVEMRRFRMVKINRPEALTHKKMRITNPGTVGRTLEEVIRQAGGQIIVSRMKHSGETSVFSPNPDSVIQHRDVLMLVGKAEDLQAFISEHGRETTDLFIESDSQILTRNLFVTKPQAIHKTLAKLDLFNTYDLNVTRVFRAGREMVARPSLELFYGDILRVTGSEDAIREAEKIIGNHEKKLLEADFLSIFGGLILGVILGSVPLAVPGLPVPLKLGFAAGPLIVALLISRFGGISFIHSYMNTGAIYFMKDFGICLFFGAVGIHAGEGFYENFVKYNGWQWLFYGSLITFIPLIITVLIGRFVLKINFLQLAGILSGSYTDPAALSFSTTYLQSDVPIQSYAQVYPLVTIARIFVASLLILLFSGG